MSAYAKQLEFPMLIDEFVEWMKTWTDTEKYELLDGEPVAMAGGTVDNEIVTANIAGFLYARMRDRGCRPYRDLLLCSPVSDRFGVFPDVYVRCGPPGDGRRTWVDDAVAVFEVLSPSTIAIDRGYKQEQYLRMPTLQHYVLVHPREFRVEVWSRDAEGGWSEFPASANRLDETVALPALDLTIPMTDIYADTELVRAAS
ncbi:Uma2 family endonuclease [Prosthecomicrobium sp. N25]|uniref:Uma2 family endonuclease n=1 Tax=Prosthecomicrobium sp. N25 TaxID=3129254 RepID=UPI003077B9D9